MEDKIGGWRVLSRKDIFAEQGSVLASETEGAREETGRQRGLLAERRFMGTAELHEGPQRRRQGESIFKKHCCA